jgi:hypothetical protein
VSSLASLPGLRRGRGGANGLPSGFHWTSLAALSAFRAFQRRSARATSPDVSGPSRAFDRRRGRCALVVISVAGSRPLAGSTSAALVVRAGPKRHFPTYVRGVPASDTFRHD